MGSQLTPEMDGSLFSETFSVKALGTALKAECRWRFSRPLYPKSLTGNALPYCKSIDLVLDVTSSDKAETNGRESRGTDFLVDCTDTPLGTIINKFLTSKTPYVEGNGPDHAIKGLIKVLLVPRDGYLCRRDILQLRMVHSDCIESVVPFQVEGKPYPAVPQSETNLLSLLQSSPGALICKRSIQSARGLEAFDLVDREVNERLSFEWVIPDKPPALTVAVVGGRPLFDSTTGGYGSEGPFDAARALGIAVVVLDRPGHFMEGPKYSHLRDDFIAVDMTSDDCLPQRLTAAVKGHKIDGIITFSDEYVIATAKAAEMLNLETEPVDSIITAHYKDATRKVLNTPNMQSLRLESAADLDSEEISKTLETLKYPLVIKPCRGGASRGVKKVQNHQRLREAIDQLENDGLTKYGILLETYISGPEIDANIALWDGELMFAEITDDFPCTADATDATIADNFGETVMVSPTLLCQKEQNLIKSSLHKTLLKLGFRNGVFHVEARVQNSSMRYQEIDGIVDLADTDNPSPSDPEVYLIEVNARPPGLDCAFSTLHAYGVDLCALQLLQCLRDGDRFKAMWRRVKSRIADLQKKVAQYEDANSSKEGPETGEQPCLAEGSVHQRISYTSPETNNRGSNKGLPEVLGSRSNREKSQESSTHKGSDYILSPASSLAPGSGISGPPVIKAVRSYQQAGPSREIQQISRSSLVTEPHEANGYLHQAHFDDITVNQNTSSAILPSLPTSTFDTAASHPPFITDDLEAELDLGWMIADPNLDGQKSCSCDKSPDQNPRPSSTNSNSLKAQSSTTRQPSYASSSRSPVTVPRESLNARFQNIMECVGAMGFESFDDLVTSYYADEFEEASKLFHEQRFSRIRRLPGVFAEILEGARRWEPSERRGLGEEVLREAEAVLMLENSVAWQSLQSITDAAITKDNISVEQVYQNLSTVLPTELDA
ncbi:hypothetical protein LB504_008112 [Fusarium proliferatum]|nr:hypothetical protein LB504_008112 [Fusarium proliferatum]